MQDFWTLDLSSTTLWIIIGFIGQALFMMRFFAQWVASNKARKSVIPISFWYFSIGGSLVLLIYAIHRQDPVFIVGQALAFFIYVRNLTFIARPPRNDD